MDDPVFLSLKVPRGLIRSLEERAVERWRQEGRPVSRSRVVRDLLTEALSASVKPVANLQKETDR